VVHPGDTLSSHTRISLHIDTPWIRLPVVRRHPPPPVSQIPPGASLVSPAEKKTPTFRPDCPAFPSAPAGLVFAAPWLVFRLHRTRAVCCCCACLGGSPQQNFGARGTKTKKNLPPPHRNTTCSRVDPSQSQPPTRNPQRLQAIWLGTPSNPVRSTPASQPPPPRSLGAPTDLDSLLTAHHLSPLDLSCTRHLLCRPICDTTGPPALTTPPPQKIHTNLVRAAPSSPFPGSPFPPRAPRRA